MAEEAAKKVEAGAEGAAAPAAKKDILTLVILVLAVVNLAAVAGMGYLMQVLSQRVQEVQVAAAQPVAVEESHHGDTGKELGDPSLGTLFPLETFLININSDSGPKYLQTQIELEIVDSSLEDELTRRKAAIRDAVIVLLGARSFKELREPAGMRKARADLVRSVNNLLTTGKIKDLYFTQFHFN